ncbi:MAG: hypothetical protein CM1200mP12_18970 [Gammaproteobacteria bacterium]|nr:MAG: hypothetical protein CM1200mP12_18970 [Gammaproteobacteria bacterium]
MGNDAALACLSETEIIFDIQTTIAQVTNPAIVSHSGRGNHVVGMFNWS